jgi:hypothetical protein
MFGASIRTEDRMRLVSPMLRFACVSDLDEYCDLLRDPACTVVHYFEPVRTLELDGASTDAFDLIELTIDGRRRVTRGTTRAGTQIHTANVSSDATNGELAVAISFAYRTLVQRNGHLFHLDFSRPTRDVKVQFAYGDCGICYVNVLDYIASSKQSGLTRLPASGPTPSIALRFDGWILPKAGVAFVWVLVEEFVSGSTRDTQLARPRG